MKAYVLHRAKRTFNGPQEVAQRIIPSRPSKNLRRGGGRRISTGWSKHTIRSNKQRLEELARWIQSCITVKPPSGLTGDKLSALNECMKNFFKQRKIPARCVWEGPSPHCHIALGIACELHEGNKLDSRLRKAWRRIFGESLSPDAVQWKPAETGEKVASYLGKVWKDGRYRVKDCFSWLSFCPRWECHFRALAGREKSAGPKPDTPLIINDKTTARAASMYMSGNKGENAAVVHGFSGSVTMWRTSSMPD